MDGIYVDDCSNESVEQEQRRRRRRCRNSGTTLLLWALIGTTVFVALSYGFISFIRQTSVDDNDNGVMMMRPNNKKENKGEENNRLINNDEDESNSLTESKEQGIVSVVEDNQQEEIDCDDCGELPSSEPSPKPTTNQPTNNQPTTNNESSNNNDLTQEEETFFSSSESLLCDPSIECTTDRLGNTQPLTLGQSMCNEVWRFGVVQMTEKKGALVWQDCNTTETLFLQNITTTNTTSLAFRMTTHGVFQLLLLEEVVVVWELESRFTNNINLSQKCVYNDRPSMDCPYLHLRKRGGSIVLNYIDNDQWMAKKVHRSYPNLFPSDSFFPNNVSFY